MPADAAAGHPGRSRRAVPRLLSVAAGGLCLLLGSIGAVFVPSLLPVWIVLGGLVGGGVYVAAWDRATDGPRPSDRVIGRGAVLAGAATTAVCLVLTGVGSILGVAGGPVILLLLLLALAPWVWRARPQLPGRAGADGRRTVPQPPSSAPGVRPDAGELAADELCRAWQQSYLALIDVPEGPVREDIATWRRNLLDELERRDPVGFDDWLRNGARAGSDPTRYLDLTSDH